jgi:hypothetical protein
VRERESADSSAMLRVCQEEGKGQVSVEGKARLHSRKHRLLYDGVGGKKWRWLGERRLERRDPSLGL